jgi:hypothetical protein
MPTVGNVDKLLRTAIPQKRLVQLVCKGKRRIVEPHDYGIHKGSVKLSRISSGRYQQWAASKLALD